MFLVAGVPASERKEEGSGEAPELHHTPSLKLRTLPRARSGGDGYVYRPARGKVPCLRGPLRPFSRQSRSGVYPQRPDNSNRRTRAVQARMGRQVRRFSAENLSVLRSHDGGRYLLR